jgi:hypothetical protein
MLPLFFGFFTVKYFSPSSRASREQTADLRQITRQITDLPAEGPSLDFFAKVYFPKRPEAKKRASDRHRRPVLTSETTKRKNSNTFPCSIISVSFIPGCREID